MKYGFLAIILLLAVPACCMRKKRAYTSKHKTKIMMRHNTPAHMQDEDTDVVIVEEEIPEK